ncbi:MAG: hypothetical protein JNL85_09880 [Rubrivivax sp.]|nr:hypothetical protein [Rubrivivax sp.]
MIAYSLGRNRFDARPKRCEAATWREFVQTMLRQRARDKRTAAYICGALGNDGRRSRDNAGPCTWLALDADAIDPNALPEWRLFLTRYRGFGWPTASSTPEAPRERVIVELSEPVNRAQRMSIGALLGEDIEQNFGPAVVLDPSVYRPEQPVFLAPVGAVPFYLLGDPLDVPRWLRHVPPPPPEPAPPTADVVALADARMRVVVQQLHEAGMLLKALPNGRGYAMRCPWEASHTCAAEPGGSATALLFPAEGNGWHGAFRCLHAHCAHRRLRNLLDLLRRAQAMVREGRAA